MSGGTTHRVRADGASVDLGDENQDGPGRSGAAGGVAILRRWTPPIASTAVGTALIAWHASKYGRYIVDDAAITYQYARNIAEGNGPVFQPGADPVEGFSNPLWTMVLVIGRWLGLFDQGTLFGVPDYVVFPKAVALLCCVGILVCAYLIAVAMVSRRLAWVVPAVVGGVLALIPSFVIWMFSGLENPLYAFLAVALATVLVRAIVADRLATPGPAAAAALLAAAAGLTRPDGAIYASAYPFAVLALAHRDTWRRAMRMALISCAVFLTPYLGYVAWRRVEFGRWVPNTAVAKSQDTPDFATIGKVSDLFGHVGWLIVVVTLVSIGATMFRPGPLRRPLLGLLIPLTLAGTAYAVLEADWMLMHRFATPAWALAAIVGTLCVIEQIRAAELRARVVVVVATCLALSSSAALAGESRGIFMKTPTVPMCQVTDTSGRAFNTYADIVGVPQDQGSYLSPDLGGLGMTSRLELRDLAGLVDAKVADYLHNEDVEGLRTYIFEKMKPTFIRAMNSWEGGLSTDPRMARDYEQFNSNATMGGSYVRKDMVDAKELAELKRVSRLADERGYEWLTENPLGSCGKTLRVGQTLPIK